MDAVIINSALSWCVAALLGAVLVALKRLYSLILANQEGTKTLLRSRLYDIHERTVEKGYCLMSVNARRNRCTRRTTRSAATGLARSTTKKS